MFEANLRFWIHYPLFNDHPIVRYASYVRHCKENLITLCSSWLAGLIRGAGHLKRDLLIFDATS